MFNFDRGPTVLLVLPTTDELIKSQSRSSLAPSYGLNILATALRHEGLETIVLDEYLIKRSVSLCNVNSWIEAIEYILKLYPSIVCVGISILTNFRKTAIQLSRSIKKTNPNLIIIWGGPHVTSLGNLLYYKYNGIFNIMVSGVVDFDIVRQIKHLLTFQSVKDLSLFLTGNSVNDIAHSVFPDYSHYISSPQDFISKIITRTSTGCPSPKCIFCSAHSLEGNYLESDLKRIKDEIIRLGTYNPKRIEFHDQDLCFNINRLRTVLQLETLSMIEQGYCHSNLHSLTTKHLDSFMETEVNWEIFIGLESASFEIRHYLGKQEFKFQNNIDEYLIRLNEYLLGSKTRLGLFIMCGVPIEKPEHIKETMELLLKLQDVDLCLTVMKVFPGTHIAQTLVKDGLLDSNVWLDEDGPPIVTAVKGEQLKRTVENWQEMLLKFPNARSHNQIDQMLLNVDKF